MERHHEPARARAATRLSTATAVVAVIGGCVPQSSNTAALRLRRIGYLSGNAQTSVDLLSLPFKERLREIGYVEGRDIAIEFRVADGTNTRLPGLATELVAMPVDVILAEALPAQLEAQRATATIPIVLVLSADPLGQHLVASYAHPGANITGLVSASYPITGKQVEVLRDTVPNLSRLAIIGNAGNGTMTTLLPAATAAGRTLRVTIESFPVRSRDELDPALQRIAAGRFDALLMLPAISIVRTHDQVPLFASQVGLPAMYSDIEFARAGGLMHMGANFAAQHRRAADYVDKLLRGARPQDLPIEQPTKFDFVVNLAAARGLGLTMPERVLIRATEILP
jgi:putative ABC transport system substrate-binding protein